MILPNSTLSSSCKNERETSLAMGSQRQGRSWSLLPNPIHRVCTRRMSSYSIRVVGRRALSSGRASSRVTGENVILDQTLKDSLKRDVEGIFDERANYEQFGVSWKRGVIMHGLPGSGKTLSVKAHMRGLSSRPNPIPTLYVKSTASQYGPTYAIRDIFKKARKMTPCLLVFEDLDSLITEDSRSYFLNEVDGLEAMTAS